MESEDLYPNDGSYFLPREPKEQEVDRKKERAKTLEGKAILKTAIEHLDEKIAFYGSVDSIAPSVKADPEQFLRMHNANELARNVLRGEKEYLESLLDSAGVKEV